MTDETKSFPEQTQRDPSKPWNQKRPLSLRSSGSELDPEFAGPNGEIPTAPNLLEEEQ